MVSKSNLNHHVTTIACVIAVHFLFAWLVTYFVSVTQYKAGRISHFAYKVIYIVLFALFIIAAGASIDKLQAQASDPIITIERNPYIAHDSTFQAEYIFVSNIEVTVDITINYQYVPSAGGSAMATTVTMAMGEHETRAAVNVAHTEVRLLDGMNYQVGSTKTATYVLPTQVPDGKRGLQLVFDRSFVLEGDSARLTLRATPPVEELTQFQRPPNSVSFANDAWPTEYYATTYEIVEASVNGVGATYTSNEINFTSNYTGNPITLMITPDRSGPWIFTHADTSIQLIDADGKPQVSIDSSKAVITEGESIELTISALPLLSSNSPLVVNYTHNNSPYTNSIGTSLSLTDSAPSKNFTITTHDRTQMDGDGEIVVTLSSGGSNYDLVSSKSVVKIKVLDKQTPRPRISTNYNNVNIVDEGATGGITFKLESDADIPTGDLTVYYEISESGNMVEDDSLGTKSVVISSGRSLDVTVQLKDDDSTFTQDSIVSLKVLADENLPSIYVLANEDTTASVFVKDLGRPSDGIFIEQLGSSTISEGDNITFQVGAPDAIDSDRKIKVNYGGLSTANFFTTAPSTLVTIPANLPSVNVSLSTTDDNDFDVSGTFEIGIAPAVPPETANYTVASTKKSFELTINDSDERGSTITGISIHAVATTITREKVARFRIIAPADIVIFHTVVIEIIESTENSILNRTQSLSNCAYHSHTNPDQVGCNITIQVNTKFAEFSIALNDNSIDGETSTITARLVSVMEPQVNAAAISTTHGSTTVTIMDDDAPPVMKLEVDSSVTNNAVVETDADANVEFEFSVKEDTSAGITTTQSASDVTIQYSVTENVGDFLMASEEGDSKTATLTKNMMSVSFNISVNGDDVDEINGNFTVRLKPDLDSNDPPTYLVSQVAEENSITINVTDDEIPVLSVGTPSHVTEGDNFEFVINSNIVPYQDIDLEICVIESATSNITSCERSVNFPTSTTFGSYLPANNSVRNETFLAGKMTSTFIINIDDDDMIEDTGFVHVYFNYTVCPNTVVAGSTLKFCSTSNLTSQVNFNVQDDDPEISIAAVDANNSIIDGNGSINEGQNAKFRLTSNQPVPAGGIDVVVNIRQLEEYLDSNATETVDSAAITIDFDTTATPPTASLTVSIAADQTMVDFTLKTITERTNNRSGVITAEIASPADPTVYTRDSQFSATINVTDIDDNLPEILIEAVGVNDGQTVPVLESNSVRFVLTSTKTITQAIDVLLCIRDGTSHSNNPSCVVNSGDGDFLPDTILSEVTIPVLSANQSVEFEVALEDDAIIEETGMISAMVLPSGATQPNYRVHAQNSATVAVSSNDPTLSIAAKSALVTEGTDTAAVFVVTTNTMVTEDTRVRVKIESPTGDFVADSNLGVVFAEFTESDTELGKEIKVPIVNDDMNEGNGSIRAYLDTVGLDSANYFIVGDDHPSLNSSATVLVFDEDELPTVSITSNQGHVTEGEDATFTLSTQNPLPVGIALSVKVNVSEVGGNFITGNVGVGPHTFDVVGKGGTSSSNFIIKTRNNLTETDNGTIEVSIIADAENYIIGNGTAGVTVLDRGNLEKPGVSVKNTNPSSSIEQGQDLLFTISAHSAPNSGSNSSVNNLSVNLKYIQSGDDFILFRAPRTITIPSVTQPVNIVIKTDNNNTSAGLVTVEILPSEEFNVVSPNEATVSVTLGENSNSDNNDPRVAVAEVAVNEILAVIASRSPSTNSPENATPTLPVVSIASMSSSVEEGHPVQFLISTSSSNINNLSVQVDISGSPGTLERDYSIAVAFNTNKNSEVIELPTINDDFAGDSGLITAELIANSSFQIASKPVATVTVLDTEDRERRRNELETANREVLTQMFGTANHATRSAVSDRVKLAFSEDTSSSISLGGYQNIKDFVSFTGQSINNETATLESLFGNSSFSIELMPDEVGYGSMSIWGLGEQHDIFNEETHSSESWSNDMYIGQVGTDLRIGNRSVAGLSVLLSNSEAKYNLTDSATISYKSNTNSYNTYVGWNSDKHDLQFHATTRLGSGEVELIQDRYDPLNFKSNLYALTLSGEKVLYRTTGISNNFATQISIQGNSHWSKINLVNTEEFLSDQSYDSNQTQLGVNLDNQFRSKTGNTFQFNASLGGHMFSKIDYSNSDLISEVEVALTNRFGFSIINIGRFVIDRDSFSPEYSSLQNSVSYDQGHDQLGTLMVASYSYGQKQSPYNQSSWSSEIFENFSNFDQYNDGVHVDTELGYGLSIIGSSSRLTPFGGIGYSDDADYKYHVGTRLQLGSDLKFELTGSHATDKEGALNQQIKLDGAFNW